MKQIKVTSLQEIIETELLRQDKDSKIHTKSGVNLNRKYMVQYLFECM